jgi:hypothetical protein
MTNKDKELNDYLDGNSELSNRYHSSAEAEPADHLNEKILSAAKEAIAEPELKPNKVFYRPPWIKPVSIAAIITLSVSLVVTMQQETGQPLISEPEPALYDSAVLLEGVVKPQTITADDDATMLEEVEIKRSSDVRMDAPAPATLGAVGAYRAESKNNVIKDEAVATKPAKKAMMKEKARSLEAEKRVFANEQLLESAPVEAELDAVMRLKQDRQRSQQEVELLKIKNLLVNGNVETAKSLYKQFLENYPDYSNEAVEEVIGEDLFSLIK